MVLRDSASSPNVLTHKQLVYTEQSLPSLLYLYGVLSRGPSQPTGSQGFYFHFFHFVTALACQLEVTSYKAAARDEHVECCKLCMSLLAEPSRVSLAWQSRISISTAGSLVETRPDWEPEHGLIVGTGTQRSHLLAWPRLQRGLHSVLSLSANIMNFT